jgi:hypothetical protein
MNLQQNLAQYGAVGVLLAVFVTLFVWMFRVLLTRFLQHLDAVVATLKEISNTLYGLKLVVETNHETVMNRLDAQHRRRDTKASQQP